MKKYKYGGYNLTVYNLIAPNSVVLDAGCASGKLRMNLSKNKNCICYGIEYDKESAEEAKKYNKIVVEMSLDNLKDIDSLPFQKEFFDYIVFADVLEHLKYPEEVLGLFKKYLKKDGKIICSIPNIAYYKKRLMLLFGNFKYDDYGICDRTHLRFFTYSSMIKLFEENSLKIERIVIPPSKGKFKVIKYFIKYFLKKLYPKLFASQVIIITTKNEKS